MQKRKITIGLPVFNGENFLNDAIDSILNQDYEDFELIIQDNASTDSTEAICRKASARDTRIRYFRNESNLGAAPNFNTIVSRAEGQYFKWMAHDDLVLPAFLSRCVTALDQDPTAVLACSRVRFIDSHGNPLEEYLNPFRTDALDPVVRFEQTLFGHPCYEIFGLIRSDQLRKTRLIGGFKHGDGVLLSHLAILGKFIEIPQTLFLSRRHREQSMYVYGVTNPDIKEDPDAYARWFDATNATRRSPLNFSRRLSEYHWMITVTPLPIGKKLQLYRSIVMWLYRNRHRIKNEWQTALSKFQQRR